MDCNSVSEDAQGISGGGVYVKELLFFYAPWCPPCRFYEREFIKPLEILVGSEKIHYINVQEEPFQADKYGVERLPTVVILERDSVRMNRTGAIDIDEIADYIGRRDVN